MKFTNYLIFRTFFMSRRRYKKRPVKKNWYNQLPIFLNKMDKIIFILKHARSPDTIDKNFDQIEILIKDLLKYKSWYISKSFWLYGYNILIMDNIKKARNEFMKNFLLERVEIEINKSKQVSTRYLKEKYIRRGIDMSLSAVEYLSEDQDMLSKIADLEDILLNCNEEDLK